MLATCIGFELRAADFHAPRGDEAERQEDMIPYDPAFLKSIINDGVILPQYAGKFR